LLGSTRALSSLVSTILEADETGTLHLPPSLLPQPGPHRRYRVAKENGQVIVAQAPAGTTKPWMELAGCLKDEVEELRRIDRIIADEFEGVDPEDWR
jgi:hypothetical protein